MGVSRRLRFGGSFLSGIYPITVPGSRTGNSQMFVDIAGLNNCTAQDLGYRAESALSQNREAIARMRVTLLSDSEATK